MEKLYRYIVLRNVLRDMKRIYIGQELEFGPVVLEVTDIGKECFLECQLFQAEKNCSLINETIFAKVIRGGVISKDQ